MLIPISQGPAIRVTLEFEKLVFKRAQLMFSKRFECDIQGEVEENNKDNLLNFLESYGKKTWSSISMDLSLLSPFRQKALSHLQKINFGEVVTYGELADKIGHPKAARAIGTACHYNPYPLFIPCHRVIASGKRLGGFAYNLKMKQLLLDFEEASIDFPNLKRVRNLST